MKIIEINNLYKAFGDNVVLDNINLFVKENEFLTLLGPSGCGKTTTLRILGGFEDADSGEVIIDGKDIKGIPAYKRNINTVFQKYSLFKHLSIADNIAFGLKLKGVDKATIKKEVAEMLRLVNLEGFENRSIDSLSGGQQQRIAIARALINNPKVLLLDEPLGALDLKLRKSMQTELKRIQRKVGITFIYVTHDQEEALTMSDTVVVMNEGKIQQIGTPIDIYNEPENRFVAKFIGESNILDAIAVDDYRVRFLDTDFISIDKGFEKYENVDVVIRPEDIVLVDASEGMIKGIVTELTFKGVHWEMIVDVNGYNFKIHSIEDRAIGQEVGLNIIPDAIHVMKKGE